MGEDKNGQPSRLPPYECENINFKFQSSIVGIVYRITKRKFCLPSAIRASPEELDDTENGLCLKVIADHVEQIWNKLSVYCFSEKFGRMALSGLFVSPLSAHCYQR